MFESTIEPLKEKWDGLGQRDRQAATLLGVALVIAIVVFGIIVPIKSHQAALQAELDKAQSTYNELLALAPKAMAAQSGGTRAQDAGSLNTEVRRQAARYGIEIQRFEPEGENLKVWLEDVRYPSVVQWLGGLEAAGVKHSELTMDDRPNPGLVSVRVTFGIGN